MYIVNAKAKDIYLENITPLNLKYIFEWYNDEDFKYATGIEKNITFQQLMQNFIEMQRSREHFLLGIFISSTYEMIGFLKGQIKYGSKVTIWINTLIIDKAFQNKGYGTKAVNLLVNFAKKKSDVSRFFIAVSELNAKGYRFWKSLGFKDYTSVENCMKFEGENSNTIIMYKLV